jgi:myo-inositol-1(or 4)-monophosphatase
VEEREGGGAARGESWIGQDLELAFRMAQLAGQEVMRYFGRPQEVVEKAPGQPVTPADLVADRLLRQELLAVRPGYGWLSEETADRPDRLAAGRVWIVDPIDGTRSFIAGRPEFAISIGLAEAGRAVAGVVLNPATAEIFWAVRGSGAYLARLPDLSRAGGATVGVDELSEPPRRLAVTKRTLADEVVLFASRSELRAGEFDPWGGAAGEAGRWRIEPVGSTAYKLVRVAAGTGDIFLSRGPKSEWDICAGALIVEDAGGRATDLRGDIFHYNRPDPRVHGILATNGRVHDEFLARVALLPPLPRHWRESRDPLHPGLDS